MSMYEPVPAYNLEREGERLANLISDLISPRLLPKIEIHSFPMQAVEEAIAFVQKHSWHGAAIGAWNSDPTRTRQAYRKGSIIRCSSFSIAASAPSRPRRSSRRTGCRTPTASPWSRARW